jgi:hypothetical protein
MYLRGLVNPPISADAQMLREVAATPRFFDRRGPDDEGEPLEQRFPSRARELGFDLAQMPCAAETYPCPADDMIH